MPNLIAASLVAAALLVATPVPQPAPAGNLQATLARLDTASARFKSAQANFHKDDFVKLIGDHTPSDGSRYFIHNGAAIEAGIKIDGKNGRIATYKNGMLRDYNPGAANCFNQVDSSQSKGRTEAFLTLGFGGSGKELSAAWDVVDAGPETVDGIKTEKLELVAKDQSVRNNFSKVILWMDLDRDISVKQQFFSAGTGDISTATFTNVKLNQKVDTTAFDFKAKPCK